MDGFDYASNLSHDAEEHGASLSAWDQHYEQISAGRFEGSLEDFRIGPVQIFHEHANQAVFQSGRPRAGTVTIGLARATAGTGWFCGHRLDGEHAIVMVAGGEFELMANAGMRVDAVCIDTARLAEVAARLHGPAFPLHWPAPGVLNPSGFDLGPIRELLDGAMALCRERPGLLQYTAARRMLALSLTDAVLDCFAPANLNADLPASAAARRTIVASARDYMRAHADEAISVPQLCGATGASRRALQYAFEEVLHLSPVSYLRVMRLNRVRSELQARGGDTVGDVAARWGFWHLSRFAADYRSLFGELPSQTRLRGIARAHSGAAAPRQP
jgi:AraC family transcriptional regulator, ethanolamine operon transcriptional activator